MSDLDSVIESLRAQLPPYIARTEVPKLLGGMVSSKTLANADSMLDGPETVIFCGRKVAYPRDALLEWLRRRLSVVRRGGDVG